LRSCSSRRCTSSTVVRRTRCTCETAIDRWTLFRPYPWSPDPSWGADAAAAVMWLLCAATAAASSGLQAALGLLPSCHGNRCITNFAMAQAQAVCTPVAGPAHQGRHLQLPGCSLVC
jgi:hypothetical protein